MTSSSNRVVYWGTGRRKTAVARVRVVPGSGVVTINGRPGDNYLNYNPVYLAAVRAPLQTLGVETQYDLLVNVRGGGLTGQADAIKQASRKPVRRPSSPSAESALFLHRNGSPPCAVPPTPTALSPPWRNPTSIPPGIPRPR